MGMETLPFMLAGAGSAVEGVSQWRQGRQQRRMHDRHFNRQQQMQDRILGHAEGQGGQLTNIEQLFQQDGLAQMLRRGPGGATLDTMAETGMPVSTRDVRDAIEPVRQRSFQRGLSELRAGAPGLGQRFGGAMMEQERRALLEHQDQARAQDAQMEHQAQEAARQRQMQAAGTGVGATQNLLQLLTQAETQRRGQQMQGMTAAMGVPFQPMQPTPGLGQPMTDIGQMLLLRQLIGGGNGNGGNGNLLGVAPPTQFG